MKRIKINLLSLATFSNLLNQYNIVKTNCKNKHKILNFSLSLNSNIYNICSKLNNNTYEFSPYSVFLLREKKYRIIMSECVNDKIVSHFLTNFALKPILEKKMLPQNVATRDNLGSKAAYNIFESFMDRMGTDKEIYALKVDISKYFYSIPHDKLKEQLARDIKDKYTLSLISKIINQTNQPIINEKINILIENEKKKIYNNNRLTKDKKNSLVNELNRVPRYVKDRGLSIGCVVNQILSVYYLTPLDRYIKEELKCTYHIRYMDDTVILTTDKDFLKSIIPKIENKINELGLQMNTNSGIFSLNHGFTFLGKTYFIKNNKLYSKTTNKTLRKALKNLYSLREEFDYLCALYPKAFIISPDLRTAYNEELLHYKINNISFVKAHKPSNSSMSKTKTIVKKLDKYNQGYILINKNRATFNLD